MDKYEFNIKVEQIKKLIDKSDYETAMKIADTIDWRRVRNANLLSMIASVYEKNNEYQEAKEILLIAFERAPIGKRLLYKLAKLALKEGDVNEAEAYYREFCDLAADDARQYILRYLILQAKGASVEQMIQSLEQYTNLELDERWMYELAELYGQAGMDTKCVDICDKIMLMFGLGQYVDKAMELKLRYAPLTNYQRDLVANRDKYEAKLRAVEEEYNQNRAVLSLEELREKARKMEEEPVYGSRYADEQPYEEQQYQEAQPVYETAEQPYEEEPSYQEEETETVYGSRYEGDTQYGNGETYEEESVQVAPIVESEEELAFKMKEAEEQERLAREMSRLSAEDYSAEHEDESQHTRVLENIRSIKSAEQVGDETRVLPNIRDIQSLSMARRSSVSEEPEEAAEEPAMKNHVMIEARSPEQGLELAIDTLKKIHQETGVKNAAVKISGSKLSARGVFASADKLSGKDLIIPEAGDLTDQAIKELEQLMERDETGMTVVLIDNARQLETLHSHNPSLASKFECIGSNDAAEPVKQPKTEVQPQPAAKPQTVQSQPKQQAAQSQPAPKQQAPAQPEKEADNRPVRMVNPRANEPKDVIRTMPKTQKRAPQPEVKQEQPEEVMDIDTFAQYACQYASEIDCSITGKSMLALYERIEIMEEDGIPLTKENAEDLIEHAADNAEKPGIGRLIKGVFSSRYDKEGLLILKEEHFMD